MRSFRALSRAAAAFSLVALMGVAPALAQQAGAIPAEAKEHFKVGVELLKDPDGARYGDAYVQFKLAYEKSNKSWKVLGNLALCAMKIERDGEAIEYYETYLAQGGKELDKAEKEQIERDLRVLKSSVATVTLSSDTAGAEVVDSRQKTTGANVNIYPLGGAKLKVGLHAGHHTLTARSGARELTWVVDLAPGQSVEHAFNFSEQGAATPPPPASGPAAPPPPLPSAGTAGTAAGAQPTSAPQPSSPPPGEPAPQGGSTLKTVGLVGAGVGGAMVIGGVVTGLLAKSKYDDLKSSCVNNRCPDDRKGDKDSVNSLATVTNVLLIGGGVVAVGGAVLYFLAPSAPTAQSGRAPSLSVTPVTWAGGGGLFAHGSF